MTNSELYLIRHGESMNDVGKRMLEWTESNIPVGLEAENERTFVFSHGVAIKTLVATIHDWPRAKTFESVTDNTSFTLLVNQEKNWQLQTFSATPHLSR